MDTVIAGIGKRARTRPHPPASSVLTVLACALLAATILAAAQQKKAYTGIISDDICAKSGHDAMRMGPTDAECTVACADAHGAAYVLVVGKSVYKLSDQEAAARHPGRRVKVFGSLDATSNTITVESITE